MTQDQEPVRQRLLSEATRLFAERGFESTSVQEIVAAAGVTKGAMYHYFDSKDDLLHEIYGRVLRMQMERLAQFADGPGPVAERLHAAAADVVDDHRRRTWTTPRSSSARCTCSRPRPARRVRAERRRYHERFRDLVDRGPARGRSSASDVPADLVVDFFFGSVHHLGTWYSTDGPLSGAEVGTLRRPAAHLARPDCRTSA